MVRQRIYASYAKQNGLLLSDKYFVKFLKTMLALSDCYDVYYNNLFLDMNKVDLGISDSPFQPPSEVFDYYYIVKNETLFSTIRGPRITDLLPINDYTHRAAEFLFCDSRVVSNPSIPLESLEIGHNLKIELEKYRHKIIARPLIYGFIGRSFKKSTITKFQFNMTAGMPIYFHGAPSDSVVALEGSALISEKYGKVLVVSHSCEESSVCDVMKTLPPNFENELNFHSATTLQVAPERKLEPLDWQKIFDAIFCRRPLLVRYCIEYRSVLGEQFPLYYRTVDEFCSIVERLINDESYVRDVVGFYEDLEVSLGAMSGSLRVN